MVNGRAPAARTPPSSRPGQSGRSAGRWRPRAPGVLASWRRVISRAGGARATGDVLTAGSSRSTSPSARATRTSPAPGQRGRACCEAAPAPARATVDDSSRTTRRSLVRWAARSRATRPAARCHAPPGERSRRTTRTRVLLHIPSRKRALGTARAASGQNAASKKASRVAKSHHAAEAHRVVHHAVVGVPERLSRGSRPPPAGAEPVI